MHGLELPAAIAGVLILLAVLWDVFETMILPRNNGPNLRITRFYFTTLWGLWRAMALRLAPDNPLREKFLGVFGPLALVFLLALWTMLLVLGFGLLLFGVGAAVAPTITTHPGNFGDYLYLSGTTLFTLGYGDKTPHIAATKALCVTESGIGFGLLACVIGYLPTLYQSFSRREAMVLRLYARIGNPPCAETLVEQFRDADAWKSLEELLREWEQWGAELLESCRSYPVLAFYRSQKDDMSWLAVAVVLSDVYEITTHLCPREVPERGALILQAGITRDIVRNAMTDLVTLLNLAEEETPEKTLSGRLLLALPSVRNRDCGERVDALIQSG